MKRTLVALILAGMATAADAQNRATVSPEEMARAFNEFDEAINRDRHVPVLARDIRVQRCIGPEEEPTEFECRWKQKTAKGWTRHRNWLAIDGKGWHIID